MKVKELENNNLKYHYTDFEAVKSILEKKNIRLTHCRDLDDNKEGKFVLENLKEGLTGYEEIFERMTSNLYIGCFCEDGDYQYLWNNYGMFNIGFDLKTIYDNRISITDKNKTDPCVTSGVLISKCHYTTKKDEIYNNVLEKAKDILSQVDFSDISSQQYAYLSCGQCFLLKHTEFIKEREWRVISYLWNYDSIYNKSKYIELNFTPDIVKSITVGKTKNHDNMDRIRKFIKQHKEYSHVKVLESNIMNVP
jgi:hypothetical protein